MNLLIKLLNLGSQCEEAGCLCESHPELFVAVTQGGHCGEDGVTVPRLPSELQVSYSCSPPQHPLLLLFFLPTPSLSCTLHPFPSGWGCEFLYSSQDLLTVKLPIECLRLCHLGEEWVSLWACNPDIPCSISLVDFYSFRGCWKWKM